MATKFHIEEKASRDGRRSPQPAGEGRRAVERIERELAVFEAEERRRLGLGGPVEHWHERKQPPFTEDQRSRTTILFGGLTRLHDSLIEAGLSSLGFRIRALECPANEALQLGREFGNRGQCNPTYYTVGNLLKFLMRLRDEAGLSVRDIMEKFVYVTAGACGPCRFGSYLTEYRKALRDCGFEGFRLLDARRYGAHGNDPGVAGLRLDLRFYRMFCKCLFAADVINLLGYRTRPYEVSQGATDAAIESCRQILYTALSQGRSVLAALRRCRRTFATVEVDRLRPKPKVSIIGEFWAMTTEGEGNYQLQRFLESEGAECDIEPVAAWGLYEFWETRFDIREQMLLRRRTACGGGPAPAPGNMLGVAVFRSSGGSPILTLAGTRLLEFIFRKCFALFAWSAGLESYTLPDMDRLARISSALYPLELRGGEGHMEVGKVIDAAVRMRAHMVVSVKPFGCLPSSGVSDGVQTLVMSRYPQLTFCPVETSGDGAATFYSRIQMGLFKARARAREEYAKAIETQGLDVDMIRKRVTRRLRSALHYPRRIGAATAVNAVYEIAAGNGRPR